VVAQNLTDLIAQIEALRLKGSLRRQIVHVDSWQDGKRITVPHLLVGGRLVKLTVEQIMELKS
jgi:hypothetical protein